MTSCSQLGEASSQFLSLGLDTPSLPSLRQASVDCKQRIILQFHALVCLGQSKYVCDQTYFIIFMEAQLAWPVRAGQGRPHNVPRSPVKKRHDLIDGHCGDADEVGLEERRM